jgi:hypothetical protein
LGVHERYVAALARGKEHPGSIHDRNLPALKPARFPSREGVRLNFSQLPSLDSYDSGRSTWNDWSDFSPPRTSRSRQFISCRATGRMDGSASWTSLRICLSTSLPPSLYRQIARQRADSHARRVKPRERRGRKAFPATAGRARRFVQHAQCSPRGRARHRNPAKKDRARREGAPGQGWDGDRCATSSPPPEPAPASPSGPAWWRERTAASPPAWRPSLRRSWLPSCCASGGPG